MNIIGKIVIANAAWNGFLALVLLLIVYGVMSIGVTTEHEAATIGLTEVMNENAMWFTLGIGIAATWVVSATCGWLKIFENVPWDFIFISAWLSS